MLMSTLQFSCKDSMLHSKFPELKVPRHQYTSETMAGPLSSEEVNVLRYSIWTGEFQEYLDTLIEDPYISHGMIPFCTEEKSLGHGRRAVGCPAHSVT